jgi:sulfur relay (sulfurtransferase) complex TusBCD TusD component (DsrE family)
MNIKVFALHIEYYSGSSLKQAIEAAQQAFVMHAEVKVLFYESNVLTAHGIYDGKNIRIYI